jgi:hypothetical protein
MDPAPSDFEQIRYEVRDSVLTITLHRPERLNAFTETMADELVRLSTAPTPTTTSAWWGSSVQPAASAPVRTSAPGGAAFDYPGGRPIATRAAGCRCGSSLPSSPSSPPSTARPSASA